jgi:hypothetical protein
VCVLGFESWEQYGEQEWGFTRQHLNRLATSAYIQNLLEPIGSEGKIRLKRTAEDIIEIGLDLIEARLIATFKFQSSFPNY